MYRFEGICTFFQKTCCEIEKKINFFYLILGAEVGQSWYILLLLLHVHLYSEIGAEIAPSSLNSAV